MSNSSDDAKPKKHRVRTAVFRGRTVTFISVADSPADNHEALSILAEMIRQVERDNA